MQLSFTNKDADKFIFISGKLSSPVLLFVSQKNFIYQQIIVLSDKLIQAVITGNTSVTKVQAIQVIEHFENLLQFQPATV
jgi:hypothetical protein